MSDPGPQDKKSEQSKPGFTGTLPDIEICRVVISDYGRFFECLVETPHGCRHVLHYGGKQFCFYKEREVIAARTKITTGP